MPEREIQQLDLSSPRSIPEIFGTTLTLYARNALLLLMLAAVVVIPYEVVFILVVHGVQINSNGSRSTDKVLVLAALEFLIVQPLLAALYSHTLMLIGERQQPRLPVVFRRALAVLLNVIAAEIIAGICIFAGFFVFVIPGVFLAIRFAVVAQAAAIENLNWPAALRRGYQLTAASWWRVLIVLLVGGLVSITVTEVAGALVNPGLGPVQVIVGTLASVLTLSFSALLTAVLYFDLRARHVG